MWADFWMVWYKKESQERCGKKKKKKDRQKDVGRVVVTAEMKKAGISEKRLAGTISHGKQCRGLQENVCLGTHVR